MFKKANSGHAKVKRANSEHANPTQGDRLLFAIIIMIEKVPSCINGQQIYQRNAKPSTAERKSERPKFFIFIQKKNKIQKGFKSILKIFSNNQILFSFFDKKIAKRNKKLLFRLLYGLLTN